MIPKHEDNGNLPIGIHETSLEEVIKAFNYNEQRSWLIDGLRLLIAHLENAGCTKIYLDGSFITTKELPNDYDLAWSVNDVNGYLIDPILLDLNKQENRKKIEIKYRGDIFPAEWPEGRTLKVFSDFFQTDKETGKQKGILSIELGGKSHD